MWGMNHMEFGRLASRLSVLGHQAQPFREGHAQVDPSITILASGAMPDEMTINGIARVTTGKLVAEFGQRATGLEP